MKTIYSFILIASCLFLLTACPVGSAYPLGKMGQVKADPTLLGTWTNEIADSEARSVTLTKGEVANTYGVTVNERGESFMADDDYFIGWLTILKGKTFLVLQQLVAGEPTETYYVYHIKHDKNTLTTSDITLKVNGTEAITSIESYQEEVIASMQMSDFLAGDIIWKKSK